MHSAAMAQADLALPGRYPEIILPAFAPDEASPATAIRKAARLLIVEDDHLVAMELEHVLLDAGFEVSGTAVTAEEAVRLAVEEKPDLVIMDIRLAGPRDGVDAAVELFGKTGIRCIFATAHQDAGTRLRAQPAQPLAWLSKPYHRSALLQAVREALSNLQRP
jgi:two-component system, response regulator PdtaR